jgi:hypothetical protein
MPRKRRKSIFFPPKSKALAKKVSIESPSRFKQSIRTLKQGGLSLRERRALILAQNRARAMLKRRDLSAKERIQMRRISKIRIPKK